MKRRLTFDPQNPKLCAYICAQVYIDHHIPTFVLLDLLWLGSRPCGPDAHRS